MVSDKPIQARSKHHIGDMYVHKKHKFVVRIIGRGEYSGRLCEVVHGEVPEIVLQRVRRHHGSTPQDRLNALLGAFHNDEDIKVPLVLDYSTCALSQCFTKLKAGQVLFG